MKMETLIKARDAYIADYPHLEPSIQGAFEWSAMEIQNGNDPIIELESFHQAVNDLL